MPAATEHGATAAAPAARGVVLGLAAHTVNARPARWRPMWRAISIAISSACS